MTQLVRDSRASLPRRVTAPGRWVIREGVEEGTIMVDLRVVEILEEVSLVVNLGEVS